MKSSREVPFSCKDCGARGVDSNAEHLNVTKVDSFA
jgi:hypothetical protein